MTTYFPAHLHIGVYRITLTALEPVELSAFSAQGAKGGVVVGFQQGQIYYRCSDKYSWRLNEYSARVETRIFS
jgi:hypothetical protein